GVVKQAAIAGGGRGPLVLPASRRKVRGRRKIQGRMQMNRRLSLAALFGAAFAVASPALAQQPPNPLDAIPDQVPFNVAYGAPITVERAAQVMAAAVAEAKNRNWPLNIAIVDSGANLVLFQRMDGAQLASIEISQHKARAAAAYRRESKVFEAGVQGGFT